VLKNQNEIELTVIGRKSGKHIPRPVWFVVKGKEVLFLPVTGTDSQWYKNILRDPSVKLRVEQQTFGGKLRPITSKDKITKVIDLFKEKYGAPDVKRYYPKTNAAASLELE